MIKKKDDGIAVIKTTDSTGRVREIKIEEEIRDQLQKHDFSKGPRNLELKPPPAYANMTTTELEKIQYSGFRTNDFSARLELWVVGQVRGWRSYQEITVNPAAIASLHEEVFKTLGTITTTDIDTSPERKLH